MGWVGENEVCEANKALRFIGIPAYEDQTHHVPLQCAFRRLFFDGLAVGKFETGINTQSHHNSRLTLLSSIEAQQFIGHVLDLPVVVANKVGEGKATKLGKAGNPLAQAYAIASTASHQRAEGRENWWVMAGPPLLFLEIVPEEYVELPAPAKTVIQREEGYGFKLMYGLMPYAGKYVRTWVMQLAYESLQDPVLREAVRTLRLDLLSLKAEHECLRLVLRNV